MAFRVSKIDYVPDVKGFNFYVFVLGKSWPGGSLSEVERSMNCLGEKMSDKGAIVRGYNDDEMRRELDEKFPSPGFGSRDFNSFVGLGHKDGAAIFITSAHPNNFVAEQDLSIYLPLDLILERYGSMDRFYDDLCQLVTGQDQEVVGKFIDLSKDGSYFKAFKGAIEVKPGFMGISFNMKEFYKKIKKQ